MPIVAPNLDDRDFADLLEEARQLVTQRCPGWTDLTPGDPGIVLLELFAHLTDVMLYRLNRIPDKAYVEFLRLIGVRLHPPGAAAVQLELSVERPADAPVEIPLGTRVTVARPLPGEESPVFATAEAVAIPAGATSVRVSAYDGEIVEAELAGAGTGQPSQSVVLQRPPVVAPTGDARDIVVGVEAMPDELGEQASAIPYAGRLYRVWTEVEGFATTGPGDLAYVVDRLEGVVIFAPAARLTDPAGGGLAAAPAPLAAVPAAGREIRVWYRRGGGARGNVPEAAACDRPAETLENALVRGPQELHSLNRVVTARDFELTARSFGAVARARAVARTALWAFAKPGEVEVALVPELPESERPDGRVTAGALRARQTGAALAQVAQVLDERRPLGTRCRVTWCRYKTVSVRARLHVRREEDVDRVRAGVLRALHGAISPLPDERGSSGWSFGQPLRVSDVYYVAQHEPGVRYVDSVRLELDSAPDHDAGSIAADPFQPGLWYAGSGSLVFTSGNDGGGWEEAGRFADERVRLVGPHPGVAGLLAVVTDLPDGGSRVHVTEDSGEAWRRVAEVAAARVRDVAWVGRDGEQELLLATDHGLYELGLGPDATPVPVLVDPADPSRPLHAVAATSVRGISCVAVAARDGAGVFLSRRAGRAETFQPIGLGGQDVRVLRVQREGPRAFLWAGLMVGHFADPGPGCRSWELGAEDPVEGWAGHGEGWTGGSCTGLAFAGGAILAASHHGGVLRLDSREDQRRWRAPDVNFGLPLRDAGRFDRLDTVAAGPDGRFVMAGGGRGLALTTDAGATYTSCRRVLTTEDVTVPPTWLLCSGAHEIEVVKE
jgi:hypothetical protein